MTKAKPFEADRRWVRQLQKEIAAIKKRMGEEEKAFDPTSEQDMKDFAHVRDAHVLTIRIIERMIVDVRSRMPPFARIEKNVTYLEPVLVPIDPYEAV